VGDDGLERGDVRRGERAHGVVADARTVVAELQLQRAVGDDAVDRERVAGPIRRAGGGTCRLEGEARRPESGTALDLSEVVEQDAVAIVGDGEIDVVREPAEKAVAEAAIGNGAELLLDGPDERAGVAGRDVGQVEAHREQRGEPADGAARLEGAADRSLLAAVALEPEPDGGGGGVRAQRLGERGEEEVVDLGLIGLPGVVQGLAWTPFGGDVLYIEAVANKGKGGLQLTGSLGDVMSESARLALSFLRSRADRFGLDLEQTANLDLHLHFPAGAIKKDGPSAGIAIACAFLGCFLKKEAPMDLAMTGELTVVGEVLPIGGVREKVLAAKNFGLARVILPKGNEAEASELKPELVEGMQLFFVERFEQVFDLVFGERGQKPRSNSGARRRRP